MLTDQSTHGLPLDLRGLGNPMIRSSVNLLLYMSAVLLIGGLLLLQSGTAGKEQVKISGVRNTVLGGLSPLKT